MSIQAMSWALKQPVRPAAAKLLLICIANYANEDAACWPSKARLAKDAGLDRSSICRHLAALQSAGLCSVDERMQEGVHLSSLITLNLDFILPDGDCTSAGGSRTDATRVVASVPPGVVAPVRHKPSLGTVTEPKDDASARTNVKPVTDWRQAFATDDGMGITLECGQIVLADKAMRGWLEHFDGDSKALNLALIEVAGKLQPNSPTPLASQAGRHLANIARERHDRSQNYAKAVKQNGRTAPQTAEPDFKKMTEGVARNVRPAADQPDIASLRLGRVRPAEASRA